MARTQLVFDARAPTLYLDIDGTLHAGSAVIDDTGLITLDSGRELFEFAPVLVELLAPHPSIQIVLTTSWVSHIGCAGVVSYLPDALRYRVVDDTTRVRSRMSEVRDGTDRVSKILRHVWSHGVLSWLVLDDRAWGVPIGYVRHFVHLSPESGISSPDARSRIKSWLCKCQAL
ncbi:HAD domain-containing protein [Paraburkholderia sediminicola]|uniref:HAD domain-containing protein n=1 Tax=Paraburkholderia sediminicola TaxID=458836 RepID=UPI0038BD87CB